MLADLEEPAPRSVHVVFELLRLDPELLGNSLDGMGPPQHVRPLPVARGPGAERGRDGFPCNANQLVVGPGEELALDPFGVGILRGEEPAVGMAHLAEQVLARLGGHPPVALAAGDLPRPGVDPRQLGVVVQHLLEVGDEPHRIGRIPVEPPTELVVHAAVRHAVERGLKHLGGIRESLELAAEQELQGHGLGELRRAAEPAPPRVERPPKCVERLTQQIVRERLG